MSLAPFIQPGQYIPDTHLADVRKLHWQETKTVAVPEGEFVMTIDNGADRLKPFRLAVVCRDINGNMTDPHKAYDKPGEYHFKFLWRSKILLTNESESREPIQHIYIERKPN